MNELTHLDLCSGIGGFALASERAGFRVCGFSEVKPAACRALARRWPHVPNIGDLRRTSAFARFRSGGGRSPITVLSIGYPCQGESLAGERGGAEDDRWLWPAGCSVINVVRPSWVIGENVLGHVTMGLDSVLSDLDGIGYAAQPFIIPACAVGARHVRERVWIVAERTRDPEGNSADADGERCAQLDATAEPENEAPRPLWHHSVGSAEFGLPCWDAPFAEVLRMADGLPLRLDSSERNSRIDELGNAIAPEAALPFFQWIAAIERGEL